MPAFQDFNKVNRAVTPAFVEAEIAQFNAEQQAKNRANALRSSTALGAAGIYNEAMGDRTPISDALFGVEGSNAFTPPAGAEVVGQGMGAFPSAAIAPVAETAALDATAASLAPDAAAAALIPAAETAVPLAAEVAGAGAGAAGAGGLSAASMLNPYTLGLVLALSQLS